MIGVLIAIGIVLVVVFATALGLKNSEIRVLKCIITDKNYEIGKLKVEFEEALKHRKATAQDKHYTPNLADIIHEVVMDSFNECLEKCALKGGGRLNDGN